MSQPVKLSDDLILEARLAAQTQERSIAGQVEFWAKLGRSVVELLDGRAQQRLIGGGKRKSLTELVDSVDAPEGRARLKAYLESRPFPHFEAHPTRKGMLIRIEANGRRTAGRFKNRQFVEAAEAMPAMRAISRQGRRSVRTSAGSNRLPKGRAVTAAHAL
jgi:hypothetical protein